MKEESDGLIEFGNFNAFENIKLKSKRLSAFQILLNYF